jgi:hypothetical protein
VDIVPVTTRVFAVAIVLLTKYYSGDQIEKNEIGKAFSMRGMRCQQVFGGET